MDGGKRGRAGGGGRVGGGGDMDGEEGEDTRKGRRRGGMEDEEVRGGGGDKEDEEGQEEEDEQEEEEETKRRREEETWRMRKGRRSKVSGGEGAAAGGGSDKGQGSTARVVATRQTTVRRWVDNEAQKKLDIAWAEAMFRFGIAFNFLNMDTTQTLHAVYLEVVRPKVKLPSYNHMRIGHVGCHLSQDPEGGAFIDCMLGHVRMWVNRLQESASDELLGGGEQGAILVATVTMTGRKKNAPALVRLWEQVMREIGLNRINAICTDNAEVNKKAAQILERHKDKEVARIPWVPCGAHCCSLLLKDLANLSWIKGTVKTANTIVKFIRNHHATHGLMMSIDDTLSLLHPTEVRFGSVYMMLQRLADRVCCVLEAIGTAGSFFKSLMEPVSNNGSVLSGPAQDPEEKEEQERRQRRMVKAPRGRIPKELVDSDSSGNSDLEDLVWKGKCWNESSSEDRSEEAGDSNFELREAPAVPTTSYVGRRTRQRERDLEVEPMPVVDVVDTDVEFLLQPHDDPDEEEATRAKAMADRDAELVDKPMRAEEVRRAALPTRRERERRVAQHNKHTDELVKEVDMEDGENIAMHKEENVVQQGGDEGQRADRP
ncbi:hypothetical protein CBR_g134 [Chara braunii]|uniref:DUF659 domain-containing protein n=1 Tax=Chara braunii TaxID=69332 RepID=A0A388JLP6_CHABU|nr:hypothetical protein CBR_g134 [Chara braunii]|eukprot:GBG58734.1 hypothetical protein CBR_g134 [Chara braunii]